MKLKPNPSTRGIRFLALFAMLFDFFLTLVFQSESFWNKNISTANEMNDLFRYFSNFGPSVFVASMIVYMALMFLLILYLPTYPGYVASFALILGHYFGASTWLVWSLKLGVQGAVFYGIFLSFIFVYLERNKLCWKENTSEAIDK